MQTINGGIKHLEIVDYLRGFSIFTIVLLHLAQHFKLPRMIELGVNFGGAGVHVFILCSGFGLYLSNLRKPLSYVAFLKRRFLKIYIPYILIILLTAIIPFAYRDSDKLVAVLSHVFLFKMFSERFIDSLGIQLWFVSMIFQLYFFFPFLVKLFRNERFGYNTLIALCISLLWSVGIYFFGKADQRVFNSFFLQYLWEFVLGMELAKYYADAKTFDIPRPYLCLLIAIIFTGISGIMGYMGGVYKLFNDIPSLFGYLFCAVFLYSLHIRAINSFFVFTNRISYEWYLVHVLVFSCIFHYFEQYLSMIEIFSLSLIASYLAGLLYNYLLRATIYKWV